MKNFLTHTRLAVIYMFTSVFMLSFVFIKAIQKKADVVIYANPISIGKSATEASKGMLTSIGLSNFQLDLALLLPLAVGAYFLARSLYHTIKAIGDTVRAAANSPTE